MKDLILITAYCPDNNRLEKLRILVNQLYNFKDEYDVMLISHTSVPVDIQNKVNVYLFDDKNIILTDHDLINKPWFDPNNGGQILSGFLTSKNTHLAIYRMLIFGFSLAKNIGYKKVHQIEYDCEIINVDEFKDNSKLLDKYSSIYYIEKKKGIQRILFGSTQSFNIDKLPISLLKYDEIEIKNLIRNAYSKSPEVITQQIIHNNGNYISKSSDVLFEKGNKFATSNDDNGFNPWGVPYIDLNDNNYKFIVWNTTKDLVTYKIIVNDEKVININNVKKGTWVIKNLGAKIDVFKIITIEDDKIRDIFNLNNSKDKKLFRKISWRKISKQ
tara:strand:+ start:1536 stop:2522 length:987 start_codon:yes stop_codon:yes gene_type:complete